MATILRNNMDNFLEPILFTVWDDARKMKLKKMVYPMIFNEAASKKNKETIAGVSDFGLYSVKTEGTAIAEDSYVQTAKTEITAYTYAKMFSVSEEQIEDCQYAEASKKAAALGRSGEQTVETLCANIFNNAFDSGTGGDGQYLLTKIAAIAEKTWNEIN